MPGIPTDADQFAAFAVSFWAGLYSGLIYSLFTGIVVGVVVWAVQVRMEDRRLANTYAREVALFENELMAVLIGSNEFDLTQPSTAIEKRFLNVIELARTSPLSLWDPYQRGRDALILDRLRQVLDCNSVFQSMASRITTVLRQSVRKFNADDKRDPAKDPGDVLYCTGRLIGVPPEQILPWVGQSVPLDVRERMWNMILDEPEVASASRPYLEARRQLMLASQALVNIIVEPLPIRQRPPRWQFWRSTAQ